MAIQFAGLRLLGSAARRLTGKPGVRGERAARREIRKGEVTAGRKAYKQEQQAARREATALGLKGSDRRRYVAERAQDAREHAKSEFAGLLESTGHYNAGLPDTVAKEALKHVKRGDLSAAEAVLDKFARDSIIREKSKQRTTLLDDNVAGEIRGGATEKERASFISALARGSSVTEAARDRAREAAQITYADVRARGPEAYRALAAARQFNDRLRDMQNISKVSPGKRARLMREAGYEFKNGGWYDSRGFEWTLEDVEAGFADSTPINTRRTLIRLRTDKGKNTGDTGDHGDVFVEQAESLPDRAIRVDDGARNNLIKSLTNAGLPIFAPGIFSLMKDAINSASPAKVREWHKNTEVFTRKHAYSSDRTLITLKLKEMLDAMGISMSEIPDKERKTLSVHAEYTVDADAAEMLTTSELSPFKAD